MTLTSIRTAVIAALLAGGLVQPLAAQDLGAVPGQRQPDGRGVALSLAAIAALGLLIHEAKEDEEEEEQEREERRRTLPADCLVTWGTPDGAATLYDPDCLDGAFPAAAELPLDCAVTVRSDGRFVSGFSPACLNERGWRTPQ